MADIGLARDAGVACAHDALLTGLHQGFQHERTFPGSAQRYGRRLQPSLKGVFTGGLTSSGAISGPEIPACHGFVPTRCSRVAEAYGLFEGVAPPDPAEWDGFVYIGDAYFTGRAIQAQTASDEETRRTTRPIRQTPAWPADSTDQATE